MKMVIGTKGLANVVKILKRVDNKDNTVVIDIGEKEMTLSSSSNILFGTATVPFESKDVIPRKIGLNFKYLAEIVDKISAEELVFDLGENELVIVDGKAKFRMLLVKADLFKIEMAKEEISFTRSFTSDEFVETMGRALFAVSHDDARPVFSGVMFVLNGATWNIYGTDTHVLSKQQIKDESPEFSAIVPAMILKIVPSGDVTLSVGKNKTKISFDNVEFCCSNIQGTMPDLERAIPKKETMMSFNINKKNAIIALEKVMICAGVMGSTPVQLSFSENEIEVFSDNKDLGSINEFIPITQVSPNLVGQKIAFQGKYLLEGFKRIESVDAIVFMTQPLAPIIIENTTCDFWKYVVTPIRMK